MAWGTRALATCARGSFSKSTCSLGSVRADAIKEMDLIAREVLANPVMEDYRVEFID